MDKETRLDGDVMELIFRINMEDPDRLRHYFSLSLTGLLDLAAFYFEN